MLNPEIYLEKIFYYTNIIDNPQEIISFLENEDEDYQSDNGIGKWEDWKTSSDDPYQFGERKNINSNLAENSEEKIKNIYLTIDNAIKNTIFDFKEKTKEDIGEVQSYGIAKYFPGRQMGEHVDFDLKSIDSSKISLIPTISSVLYLNDNYVGGEIEFPQQDIVIKPSAGSMVIFPSVEPFYHKSNEIIEGYKYIIPIFCYKHQSL